MVDQQAPDPQFDAMTARRLRREAMRQGADALNTTSAPGLEDVLARISIEVTEEAAYRRATAGSKGDRVGAAAGEPKPPARA